MEIKTVFNCLLIIIILNKLNYRTKKIKFCITDLHTTSLREREIERGVEREIYVVFFVMHASGSCYNHTDPVPQEEADPGQAFQ